MCRKCHEMTDSADSPLSISLDIPAREPDIFRNKATNDVLLLLSRNRFGKFTIGDLASQLQ